MSSDKYTSIEDIHIQQIRQIEFEKDLLSQKQAQLEAVAKIKQINQAVDLQIFQNNLRAFSQRQKQLEALRKIRRSSIINQMRMKKTQVKYKLCQEIFDQVLKRLKSISDSSDSQYRLMLLQYIVQGCIAMFQEQIKIHVLKKDVSIVKNLLPDVQECFQSFVMEFMGRQFPLKLQIIENDCLIQRQLKQEIEKKQQDRLSVGGVILSDCTGNIVYKNTFDTRLNIVKQNAFPLMIQILWKIDKV